MIMQQQLAEFVFQSFNELIVLQKIVHELLFILLPCVPKCLSIDA
jgi:hypothetical protein